MSRLHLEPSSKYDSERGGRAQNKSAHTSYRANAFFCLAVNLQSDAQRLATLDVRLYLTDSFDSV